MACWIFDSRIHHLIHHVLLLSNPFENWHSRASCPHFRRVAPNLFRDARTPQGLALAFGVVSSWNIIFQLSRRTQTAQWPDFRSKIIGRKPSSTCPDRKFYEFYVTKPAIPPNSPNFSHPAPCQSQWWNLNQHEAQGLDFSISPIPWPSWATSWWGWAENCHAFPRLMMKITGQHPAEDLLLSASMPQSTDLRQIGLVDDIVEKPEDGGRNHRSCGMLRPCTGYQRVESAVFAVSHVFYRPNVFGFWLTLS